MVTVVVNNQELEFPDYMSQEEIKAVLRQKFPTQVPEVGAGLVGKLGQGMTFGLADEMQAGLFALPRYIGNEIIGKEGGLGGAYNELLESQRANLQAAQEQYPITSTGLEIAGALGTGVAGAGTKLGKAIGSATLKGLAPAAASTAGKLGNVATKALIGGATGAASSGLYGYGTGEGGAGNRLSAAKDYASLGATVGAGIPLATSGLGAVALAATPKIDEGLREVGKLAQKYKIPLSLEQLTSSRALKTFQKNSQDLPLSGQAAFRDKQLSAWNEAVIKTFGGEGNKFTPELADKAFTRLGSQFNALGKGKVINAGSLADNINKNVIQSAQELGASKDAIEGLQQYLSRAVLPEIQTGTIKGETLNAIRAEVNAAARKATNIDAKILYRDLENEIIDTLTEGSGKAAKAFSKIKEQYKNLLAVEPLFTAEKGGLVKPSLLTNRVNKIYKRAAVRGKAGELGDLARIGRSILGEAGGSDTAGRVTMQLGTYGLPVAASAMGVSAPVAIGMAGATVGLNRAFQSFFNRNQSLINRLLQNDAKAIQEVVKRKPAEAKMIMEGVKQLKAGAK